MPVSVRLMGEARVEVDGRPVAIGGAKQQLVLAALALSAGSTVGTDRLIDLVWGDRPPRTARRTLQSYVSSLRTTLGAESPLAARPGGYSLDIARAQVDLLAFEDDVAAVLARRESPPAVTATALESALETWQTPRLPGRVSDALTALLVPFEELRLQAVEALVAAQIDGGRAGDAVRRLEALVRENPTRENLWLQLARGAAMLGRRDAALRTLQRAREELREQLGIEPSAGLQRLELELLDGAAVRHDTDATLPSGQVTFVFTDIEGSTKLLRSLGDDYQAVLDEHRRILRAAWTANQGHEINVDGDAFFVAFDDASAAVRGCIAAQRGLEAHRWPNPHPVRVRMGIHTGIASPHDGDYAALAVNRAARIADAAHGGQVLISADTARLLEPNVAERLHTLGRFRVRDFDQPIEVLAVDTGCSDMHRHAPRVTPADGHNLTSPQGAFVGRSDELDHVPGLLAPGRLVTITGHGGVGKTRLAIELGVATAPSFTDGVWMAALDAIDDPGVIGEAIADAVGYSPTGLSELWPGLLDHLADRQLLLVLDNCEHLLADCAARAAELLQHCPTIAVLATSRQPLGLLGERVVRLGPLANVPSDGEASEAVRLFVERAARPPPLDAATMRDVEQLCADVDGLPLAIELVACRTDTLTPNDIRIALSSRSPMLSSADPRVPERHRSLDGLLDWSYRLLSEDEQVALRRLTVFAATFDRSTAATVIDADGSTTDVDELVWSLAAKSLILVEPAAGTTRYRMLRTVRSYAAARSDGSELVDAARRLAERFAGWIGPDVVPDRAWVGDVQLELNNVRALVADPGIDVGLRQKLAWSIAHLADLTDRYATGIAEVTRHLDLLADETPERVALLTKLADMQLRIGDLAGADATIDAADVLCAHVGPADWDDQGVRRSRSDLLMRAGRHAAARAAADAALAAAPSLGGRARLLDVLGLSFAETREYEAADEAFRRELEAWTDLGNDSRAATTLGNLAEIALRRGRVGDAARYQLACLDTARSLGQPLLVAFSMIVAAQLAARRDQWREAVGLQRTADGVLGDVGYVLFDTDADARRDLLADAARHLQGTAASEHAEHGLPVDEAIEIAARILQTAKQPEEQP